MVLEVCTPIKGKASTPRRGHKVIEGCERIVISAPLQTGILKEDMRRKQLHIAKAEIVSWLEDKEDCVLSTLSMMKTDMVSESNLSQETEEFKLKNFHQTWLFPEVAQILAAVPFAEGVPILFHGCPLGFDGLGQQRFDQVRLAISSCARRVIKVAV